MFMNPLKATAPGAPRGRRTRGALKATAPRGRRTALLGGAAVARWACPRGGGGALGVPPQDGALGMPPGRASVCPSPRRAWGFRGPTQPETYAAPEGPACTQTKRCVCNKKHSGYVSCGYRQWQAMSVVPILTDEGGHDVAVISVYACHIFQRIVTSAGQGACSTGQNPMPRCHQCQ